MLERIIRYKVYWQRSAFYESIIKALGALALIYKLWEDDPLGVWMYKYRFIVTPSAVIVYISYRLCVGYLDKRFIRRRETDEVNETNPRFMDMHGKVNRIYNKMFNSNDNSTGGEPSVKSGGFGKDGKQPD